MVEKSAKGPLPLVACAASLLALLLLVALSCLLSLGDRLVAVQPVLGAVFYLAVAALLACGVAWPVASVLSRPVYNLARLQRADGRADVVRCRRFVARLMRDTSLGDDERVALRACLDGSGHEHELIRAWFDAAIVPRVDAQIARAAKTAFACTAVSQSSVVDALTVLSVCLDLVRAVVERCGFRPSSVALLSVYARVLGCALVAGGVEELDADDLVSNVLGGGAVGAVSGTLVASAAQGVANAFLVFRVGSITADYLYGTPGASRAEVRRASYRAARARMARSDFMATVARTVGKAAATAGSAAADAVASASGAVADAVRARASEAGQAVGSAVAGTVRKAAAVLRPGSSPKD